MDEHVRLKMHWYKISISYERSIGDCRLSSARVPSHELCINRIEPSGMLCHVANIRTDVSEELSASFIRVSTIGELGTMLAITSNRRTLRRNTSGISSHFFNI
jgi:hypothetical protein